LTALLSRKQWWTPGILRTLANNMLSMDEPDHRRLRDIVDEIFRRRATLEMEPRILAIADELAEELFREGNPADLIDLPRLAGTGQRGGDRQVLNRPSGLVACAT
jgi:cytochrome P450